MIIQKGYSVALGTKGVTKKKKEESSSIQEEITPGTMHMLSSNTGRHVGFQNLISDHLHKCLTFKL